MQQVRNSKLGILLLSLVMMIAMAIGGTKQTYAETYDWYTSFESAVLTGNVLTVKMSNPVELNVAEDELYGESGKIWVKSMAGSPERKYSLTKEDKVEVNGKVITITFHEGNDIQWKGSSLEQIVFEKGTLKSTAGMAAGGVVYNTGWTITVGPSITSMEASKLNFDATGGDRQVTVNLKGANLNKLTDVDATLFTTEGKDSGIEITKKLGANPTLTFTVPENDSTENGVSYILRIGSFSSEGASKIPWYGESVYFTVAPKAEQKAFVTDITLDGQKHLNITPKPYDASQKFTLRITGANLDPKKVEVRAIDENGIVWPTYHYTACNGTIRFASTYNGNGASGGGNIVTVELMFPRTIGVAHKYTVQVSISGKGGFDVLDVPQNPYDNAPADTYLEKPVVTADVSAADREECSADDTESVKTVHVKYVDENGKEIAKEDTYKGYGVTMLNQFGIKAKDIEGYELTKSPDEKLLEGDVNNGFIRDLKDSNYTLTYEYKDTNPTPEPKPEPKPEPTPSQDAVKLAKVSLSGYTYTYTGKTIMPKVTVKDANGKVVNASLYTVSGFGKLAGKHTLTVKAKDGATGTLKVAYKVNPKKVTGMKTKAGKKKITVSWKSHKTQTTGFQIQTCTKKSFKGAKTVTVKKASAKKAVVKKMKSKKKYYVRVRAYKKSAGVNYYSAWTSAKRVKVK